MSEEIPKEPEAGETPAPDGEPEAEEPKRPPIWQLFILPLGLVLLCTLVVFSFRLAGHNEQDLAEVVDKAPRLKDNARFFQMLESGAARIARARRDSKDPEQYEIDPDGRLGKKTLANFRMEMSDERRGAWALWLGILRYTPAVEELQKAAAGDSAQLSIYAIRALEQIGKEGTGEAMVPLLGADKPAGVRAAAVHALARLGGSDYISTIAPLLGDQEWDVRSTAAMALAMLNDPSGKRQLLELLDRADVEKKVGEHNSVLTRVWSSGDRTIGLTAWYMVAAISALAQLQLNDPAILEQLGALVKTDPSDRVRRAAKAALLKLGPG